MAAAGFLSHYLSGPLLCLTPYNRKKNVLSASLNKTFLLLPSDQAVIAHTPVISWAVCLGQKVSS